MVEETKRDGKTVTDGEGTEYNAQALSVIGHQLRQKFNGFKRDRRLQEQQWLRNLYQFKGKYDPDIEEKIGPDRSKAYPKLTRTKVMIIVARLMNLLFPQSDKSWSIEASPVPHLEEDDLRALWFEWKSENPDREITEEELDMVVRRFADRAAKEMERHIEDQLQGSIGSATEADNSDFVALCRRVILSAAIYNVGVLKGPMTLTVERSFIDLVPGGMPVINRRPVNRPYFEAVDVWRYYPDMQARTFSDMDGEFEEHIFNQMQLEALAGRDDFIAENIRRFLKAFPDGNYEPAEHEQDLDNLSGLRPSNRGKRYRVREYWGCISRKYLKDVGGLELPEGDDDQIRVTAWIGDRFVLKLALNPLPAHANIYHKFVFDDSEPGLLGGSMCEIMRDSQMAVSSAARMLIDNASVTCGPNFEINLDMLAPGQDVKSFGPFRNYYTDRRATNGAVRAINSISVDSHMSELLAVMNQFLRFADMETFVGGIGDAENTPGEALRTSAGASMVLGNAALPFRDIVRSFDRFTVSVLYSLIEWNRLFNDELNYVGDIRPVAKGATSLIAKEVRAFALDNLRNTLGEDEMIYIDPEKLLEQRLMSRDIPIQDIKATDEEIERRKQENAERARIAEEQQQRLFEAELRERNTEALKDAAQAKKNLENADATSVKTLLEVANSASSTIGGPNGNQR